MIRAGLKVLLFLGITVATPRAVAADAATDALPATLSALVTNIGQLRSLSYVEFNQGRPVSLTGTVTLVDNGGKRLVLQDATGAIMWYCGAPVDPTLIGKTVRLTCAYASPFIPTVPDFPFRPSGSDFQSSFEAPSNWGDYHLTRMEGFVRPPISGEYTFWIASDDSSELWLSTNANPACVKKIAYVMEGFWTNPHEWGRFPSQRSEAIYLRAGQTYYLEAFQEQGLQNDHLSVAWEGPGIARSVIQGQCLTPWSRTGVTSPHGAATPANGILREYWTNYAAGTVRLVTASGAVEAGFGGRDTSFQVLGPGSWPQPKAIEPGQPLQPDSNFRWVQTEGIVNFVSTTGEGATMELVAGPQRMVVHVARGNQERLRVEVNQHVQVQGVCEGVADETEELFPGVIWAPSADEIRVVEAQADSKEPVQVSDFTPARSAVGFGGYYVARGAVAFDGTVAGRRYLYVQDPQGGVCVSDADRVLQTPLEVGQRVLAGGTLSPTKAGLKLVARTLRLLGQQTLPIPSELVDDGALRDGQWIEVRGVVHSVRADGVWTVQGAQRLVSVWSPKTPADESLVDCAVRIRGVMSLQVPDAPQLLVGSSSLVEIDERGPVDPFSIPQSSINTLCSLQPAARRAHRAKVQGTVTYIHAPACFLQDESGAVRLTVQPDLPIHVGDRVEVAGFPQLADPIPVLAEPILRVLRRGAPLEPPDLNVREAVRNNGRLVRVRAGLLVQKNLGPLQVLNLHAGQDMFEAVLAPHNSRLPPLPEGSQVEVTGVCVARAAPELNPGPANWETSSSASLQILLRAPTDVIVRWRPSWWTPRKLIASIAALLTALGSTLLWMRWRERRYELRQRAQLEFSRKILQSQETERRRIAVNLHDSLGQNLLVIKNQLCLAMQSGLDRPAVLERLDKISGMASQVIEEVRQITHDLRPSQLDRVGLSQTLRGTIRSVSESCTIPFASHVDDIDGLFDSDGEIHIYRILQEGLNNVVKHSGATEATALVKKERDSLRIIVRDNGRGSASATGHSTELPQAGLGLNGICERARILRGKAAFASDPGQGFRLTVEIPLPANYDLR